ncbi:nitrate reductase [Ephemerocybe angulata]|uniref:Nitrate reductase [NADPH] n=1 Tax=Ephemerocybe angulata TaxID=980116 RepID=A0A8H6IGP7_9AGAR|nr:nitrate reductase [Tulosesus angulatus]
MPRATFQLSWERFPRTSDVPAIPADGAPEAIDTQDKGTPDKWVPRDPRMLSDLYSQGFFTSTNLFFVRNHGAVPQVDIEKAKNWQVEINGLCNNPVSFSVDDLRRTFEVVTIPITLVCAGNRRKEQNVVQKSLGFSWGAAGISTALFTGVRLADVLNFVHPQKGRRMDLPNGHYGTSQLASWARDRKRGMLLAWAMNGKALEPDHGFPLRLVVPGQIGGRSVKWLTKIELSSIESQHHLHFHDNKVLPMPVGPDQARAETQWWYDPRYIIRDLNVNSAIATPDHDQVLAATSDSEEATFVLQGYAYAGGGRRVCRVEITLDEGSSWSLAEIKYPEDLFREVTHDDPVYGRIDLTEEDTCFCWCFWSYAVKVADLSKASSIAVRAMDESLALQPRDMYWNATGMMNNWWFRVFEHPTMAGAQPGGWMQRLKDLGIDPTKPIFGAASTSDAGNVAPVESANDIALSELAEHAGPENPWFVVRGEVYDATEYLSEHPGGPQSITLVAGDDATDDFMAIHSADARRKLAEYHIGTLEASGDAPEKEKDVVEDSAIFLHRKKWKKSALVSVKDVSKDSKVFRFALDNVEQALGLPTGQHVYVRLRRKTEKGGEKVPEGELVQRAYTPLSRETDKGFIDMLVKIYYPSNVFPTGGKMTLGFSELQISDEVEFKGPIGHFTWLGDGKATIHGKVHTVRQVGLVCAGSGITPILQVLRGVFEDESDTSTEVWVIDVNRFADDILCKDELDVWAKKHPSRLHLRYSLTGKPVPEGWSHSVGRMDGDMMKAYLPRPSDEGIVCICGPPQMEQSGKDALMLLGWQPSTQIVIF